MADEITTTEQAPAKSGVEAIVAGINATPTVTEVDHHIGALSRQLARAEATTLQLVAHARDLEAKQLAHARDLFARDRTVADQKQIIATLERHIDELSTQLHRLLPDKLDDLAWLKANLADPSNARFVQPPPPKDVSPS